jgi:hypothetical protein
MGGLTVPDNRERDDKGVLTDPSSLATAALQREIAHLSERTDLQIEGLERTLSVRIDGVVEAAKVASDNLVRVPTEVQKAIASEHSLTDEKLARIETRLDGMAKLKHEQFQGIQTQFDERDLRATQQAQAAEKAVAAALQAAKEMMGEQAHNIRTITDANQAQIADIKERITRIEAIAIGQAGQKVEQHTTAGANLGLISLIVAVLSLVFGWAMRFAGR